MATAQVLPREVRLVPPPTVPQARSYLFKQQSTQGNYSAGSNTPIQINIPRLQRSYLSKDSYLKFRMKVSHSDTADKPALFFDQPGAFGVFNRIEIYDYLGSTLLESIDGTNVLTALLMNISVNKDEMSNHYNVTSGISSDTPYPLHDGKKNTTVYHEFCIPLFSFLGMLSSKFAPLHNGYTIMLTMETKERFAWTGLSGDVALSDDEVLKGKDIIEKYTIEISNVYFCAQILELGPVAESMLLSSSQGAPLVVNSKSYRHYTNTVPASSSNVRVDLNLNVSSLTNIMFTQRRTKYLTYPACKNLSMFIRNFLQSWYFQYGSSILPQTQGIQCRPPSNLNTIMRTNTFSTSTNSFSLVSGGEEAYNELLKSRHSLTSSNFDSLINNTNWNIDDDGFVFVINSDQATLSKEYDFGIKKWDASQTPSKQEETGNKTLATKCSDWSELNGRTTAKFACGLDLEVVSGKAGDLICGMNTNGMNTSIMLNFDPTLSSDVSDAMVDVWCEFDSFVNISPGIATTVSF